MGPQFVRDLLGTVQTQKADMGLLVTIAPPTRGVIDAADHGGSYTWPVNGETFPRLQVVTRGRPAPWEEAEDAGRADALHRGAATPRSVGANDAWCRVGDLLGQRSRRAVVHPIPAAFAELHGLGKCLIA